MASRGERSKLSKRLEGNINKVWSKVEKSRRGSEESQRGLMPEAEVGFSAPERPFVESRYNQLKGPWWYHRGTVDPGMVVHHRGMECRGESEERCLGEMGGGRWKGGEGGFWLWVSSLEAHLGQSLTAG